MGYIKNVDLCSIWGSRNSLQVVGGTESDLRLSYVSRSQKGKYAFRGIHIKYFKKHSKTFILSRYLKYI